MVTILAAGLKEWRRSIVYFFTNTKLHSIGRKYTTRGISLDHRHKLIRQRGSIVYVYPKGLLSLHRKTQKEKKK